MDSCDVEEPDVGGDAVVATLTVCAGMEGGKFDADSFESLVSLANVAGTTVVSLVSLNERCLPRKVRDLMLPLPR
jgi:hypothetical protein